MKKKLSLLLFIFVISYTQAQKLNLGVRLGFNKTQLSGLEEKALTTSKWEFGNGYDVGAFARIFIGNQLFIQPELNYSLEKSSRTTIDETVDEISTYTMSNWNTPLLAGYRVLDVQLLAINLLAGPIARFNNKSTIEGSDVSESFKSTNLGAQFGISLDILMFVLDARYEFGITDITKESKLQSKVFSLGIGYKLK